ncbi:hypothetical protein [Demequina flava]|uniref:hypothetical protein n=1 Tax=Demequina flava TaxID=1095025 RepID=UPI0007855C44|nr:hypothetical protein [Demequina flava]
MSSRQPLAEDLYFTHFEDDIARRPEVQALLEQLLLDAHDQREARAICDGLGVRVAVQAL